MRTRRYFAVAALFAGSPCWVVSCVDSASCSRGFDISRPVSGTITFTSPSGAAITKNGLDIALFASSPPAGDLFIFYEQDFGTSAWVRVNPIGPVGPSTVSAPRLCVRVCPPDHPNMISKTCFSYGDAGSVPVPDCLSARGTLTVFENGPAPVPPDAGIVIDPGATAKTSAYAVKFDLTIPPQASLPLSGQFSMAYERITVDETFSHYSGFTSPCN